MHKTWRAKKYMKIQIERNDSKLHQHHEERASEFECWLERWFCQVYHLCINPIFYSHTFSLHCFLFVKNLVQYYVFFFLFCLFFYIFEQLIVFVSHFHVYVFFTFLSLPFHPSLFFFWWNYYKLIVHLYISTNEMCWFVSN